MVILYCQIKFSTNRAERGGQRGCFLPMLVSERLIEFSFKKISPKKKMLSENFTPYHNHLSREYKHPAI